ncbi:MAG: hypothetical protein AAB776_01490 [Patescibacteria group bacterium]
MKLLIAATVRAKEYESLSRKITFEILKAAARKSLEGLGVTIKSSRKQAGTLLKKVYITTPSGAARVIFLIQIDADKAILVMLRLKTDKQIGSNMTVDNPDFRKVLERNIESIVRDIKSHRYEIFEI